MLFLLSHARITWFKMWQKPPKLNRFSCFRADILNFRTICRFIIRNKLIFRSARYSACVVYTKSLIHTYVGESGSILMVGQAMFRPQRTKLHEGTSKPALSSKKLFSKRLLGLLETRVACVVLRCRRN